MANRSTLSPQERLRRVDQGEPAPRRRQAFAPDIESAEKKKVKADGFAVAEEGMIIKL